MTANILGSFVTPLVLSYAVSVSDVQFPLGDMILKLVMSMLLPLLVGKGLQELPYQNHLIRRKSSQYGKHLTLLSNVLLIMIPWMKISSTVEKGTLGRVNAVDLIAASILFRAVHLIFLVTPNAQYALPVPPVLHTPCIMHPPLQLALPCSLRRYIMHTDLGSCCSCFAYA